MVETNSASSTASRHTGGGEYEEYHPYGTTAWWAKDSVTDVSQKRYRYTGQEKDEETGLCYHHHRYYMPWLARWASADPAGLVSGSNRCGYSRANPIGWSDKSGLSESRPDPGTRLVVYAESLAAARRSQLDQAARGVHEAVNHGDELIVHTLNESTAGRLTSAALWLLAGDTAQAQERATAAAAAYVEQLARPFALAAEVVGAPYEQVSSLSGRLSGDRVRAERAWMQHDAATASQVELTAAALGPAAGRAAGGLLPRMPTPPSGGLALAGYSGAWSAADASSATGVGSAVGVAGAGLLLADGDRTEHDHVNSAGDSVKRTLVKDQEALLEFAEEHAGGRLDSLVERKPGWFEGTNPKTGELVKIEWEPVGHASTNEGPHVTVRIWDSSKGKKGNWGVTHKAFIKGQESYR